MNKKIFRFALTLAVALALSFVLSLVGCSGCASCEEEQDDGNSFVRLTLGLPESASSIKTSSDENNTSYNKTITNEKTIEKILSTLSNADTADSWITCGEDVGILTLEMTVDGETVVFYLAQNMLQAKSSWLYIDVESAEKVFELVKKAK